ncbi:uncharacterized protein PHALS_14395 [Plasmopara halstedii]|uniref:Uncharacterized protein n=1 Tax=Plasmopara halstedii TaxID=4781 RepID=A0A0P1AU09_PLAHL|nr:uncharacterized protein PHALS_14395 [Plasmopara halstedii]CEG44134.1 hypothetical protein PHALS_14395 [Plasmopara halstedii]|eukprot:XP_024580503.1 hypothetical protein PHALS_14395 [Plasmopara halstedii]
MDSFGFDFAGGDLLDLGSLGSWTNSAPIGNSPNGGNNGALPFSVGTPTGVQSLGDDPFAAMPSGGDNDFSFGDSPKPSPGAQNYKTGDKATLNSASALTSTSSAPPTSSGGGDMGTNYFSSELEASSSTALGNSSTNDPSSSADDKTKKNGSEIKKEAASGSLTTQTVSNAPPPSSANPLQRRQLYSLRLVPILRPMATATQLAATQ